MLLEREDSEKYIDFIKKRFGKFCSKKIKDLSP
jgi:hypothetical protein